MTGEEATKTVLRWNDYVKARWEMGRTVDAVSDHLLRWSKERIVCPCKRNGDPSPRCKVHGKRRTSRDADNPRPGEVYEAKTSGRRWEVVSVDGDRVVMKPVGARSEGQQLWSRGALKQMTPLKSAVGSFLDAILGKPKVDDEASARKARILESLAPVPERGEPANRDPSGRLARKAKRRSRRRK
jgi:hypothetical protein